MAVTDLASTPHTSRSRRPSGRVKWHPKDSLTVQWGHPERKGGVLQDSGTPWRQTGARDGLPISHVRGSGKQETEADAASLTVAPVTLAAVSEQTHPPAGLPTPDTVRLKTADLLSKRDASVFSFP